VPGVRVLAMLKEYEHVAWGCRICNKIDWVGAEKCSAKPEHVPHRGYDIGSCEGEMLKLYIRTGGTRDAERLPQM